MARRKTLGLAPSTLSNLAEALEGLGAASGLADSSVSAIHRQAQGGFGTAASEVAAEAINGSTPAAHKRLAVLSARQLDVLTRVAAGQTSPSIATDLGLSTRTVDHYVGAVCKKLGAKSRAQAVATALRLGLIVPPPA